MPDFRLDPRLDCDTRPVAGLALSRLLLMDDRRWPWLILVPERDGLVEIFDLSPADRATLFAEAARAGDALKALTGAEKINVAALGNTVRQFHLHVVARAGGDPNWPNPVWGFETRLPYAPGEAERLIASLQTSLGTA